MGSLDDPGPARLVDSATAFAGAVRDGGRLDDVASAAAAFSDVPIGSGSAWQLDGDGDDADGTAAWLVARLGTDAAPGRILDLWRAQLAAVAPAAAAVAPSPGASNSLPSQTAAPTPVEVFSVDALSALLDGLTADARRAAADTGSSGSGSGASTRSIGVDAMPAQPPSDSAAAPLPQQPFRVSPPPQLQPPPQPSHVPFQPPPHGFAAGAAPGGAAFGGGGQPRPPTSGSSGGLGAAFGGDLAAAAITSAVFGQRNPRAAALGRAALAGAGVVGNGGPDTGSRYDGAAADADSGAFGQPLRPRVGGSGPANPFAAAGAAAGSGGGGAGAGGPTRFAGAKRPAPDDDGDGDDDGDNGSDAAGGANPFMTGAQALRAGVGANGKDGRRGGPGGGGGGDGGGMFDAPPANSGSSSYSGTFNSNGGGINGNSIGGGPKPRKMGVGIQKTGAGAGAGSGGSSSGGISGGSGGGGGNKGGVGKPGGKDAGRYGDGSGGGGGGGGSSSSSSSSSSGSSVLDRYPPEALPKSLQGIDEKLIRDMEATITTTAAVRFSEIGARGGAGCRRARAAAGEGPATWCRALTQRRPARSLPRAPPPISAAGLDSAKAVIYENFILPRDVRATLQRRPAATVGDAC
jgi:hypothetical protein